MKKIIIKKKSALFIDTVVHFKMYKLQLIFVIPVCQ